MAKPGGGRSGRVALGLQEKSEKCVAMSMVRVKHCGPWTPEVQQPFELKMRTHQHLNLYYLRASPVASAALVLTQLYR